MEHISKTLPYVCGGQQLMLVVYTTVLFGALCKSGMGREHNTIRYDTIRYDRRV